MRQRIGPTLLLLCLCALGVWQLSNTQQIAPESVTRRTALHSLLAPAPSSHAVQSEMAAPGSGNAALQQTVTAVTVDITTLPTAFDFRDGAHERWLRGEADLDGDAHIVSALQQQRQRQAEMLPSTNSMVQPVPPTAGSIDHLSTQPSLNYLNSGATPADPSIAAGKDHIIATVNGAMAVYQKSGMPVLGPLAIATLFDADGIHEGCRNYPFDPSIVYDEGMQRYILVAAGMTVAVGDAVCVAVSASSDPDGDWHLYSFDASINGSFFDFPQIGIGTEALFVGANNMAAPDGPGQLWAIDKFALAAGEPAGAVIHSLGATYAVPSPTPMHSSGIAQLTWPSGGPHYFLVHHHDAHLYDLWAWDDPLSGNPATLVSTLDLTAASGVPVAFPVDAPQLGGDPLAGNDSRLWNVVYRNGSIWTTMHLSCNGGSGPVNCVRWAKIDPLAGVVTDAGVLGTDDAHRLYPGLAVNHCGDVLMGYTKTSETQRPAIAVARLDGADLSAPPQEQIVYTSPNPYSATGMVPLRWGDYTTMALDPDGVTFWYIGLYSGGNALGAAANWYTRIDSFQVGTCQTPTLHQLYTPLTQSN